MLYYHTPKAKCISLLSLQAEEHVQRNLEQKELEKVNESTPWPSA